MPPELLDLLRRRIESSGPLRFDEFMQAALYSSPYGYYHVHVPGPQSDYVTGPSLTPWFGRLAMRYMEQAWESLGRPAAFDVVEVGAGNAALAATAIAAAPSELAGALRWVFVEPLPAAASGQQAVLAGAAVPLRWVRNLDELDPLTGVILANEVLDNFPVRVFEVTGGELLEVHVGLSGAGLGEVLAPADPGADASILRALATLEPGDRFEAAPGLSAWIHSTARVLSKGSLLVIDYGDLEPDLWIRRPAGSLVTYRQGLLGVNPLEDPGSTDITAHVNFSALQRAARDAGFTPQALSTQREWLEELGMPEVQRGLWQAEHLAQAQGRHGDWLALVSQRSRVTALGARGGLGDHLVFSATRQATP